MPVAGGVRFPGERVRLAVAVRTEELEVFDAVVEAVAIDVVEGHRERLIKPLVYPAALTPLLLQAGVQEPLLQVAAVAVGARREDLFRRLEARPRHEEAAMNRVAPRRAREAERLPALAHGVTCVVERLHRRPVVSAPALVIDLLAEPARVVGDRGLGEAEPSGRLSPGEPLPEQLGYPLAGGDSGTGVQRRWSRSLPPRTRRRPVNQAPEVVMDGRLSDAKSVGDLNRPQTLSPQLKDPLPDL